MNKNELFYASIVINIIGLTLIGLGLGKIFNEIWIGILIGSGIGMIITAIILFKTNKKLSVDSGTSAKDKAKSTVTLAKNNLE